MEGDNVANNLDYEEGDNKTVCLSIDDVSGCSEDAKEVEKETVDVNLEGKLKGHEENAKDLQSVTPAELAKLRAIFGANFTMDVEIDKP